MATYQNSSQGNYGANYNGRVNGAEISNMSAAQWEQEVQRPMAVTTPATQWDQTMAATGLQRIEGRSRTEERMARWRNMLSDQPLDMVNPMSQEAIENPMNQAEVALGSLKGLLMRNLGHYVVATFVVGVSDFVVWRGVLESVGNDYLVIYQPNQDRHVSCDFYSLKFIEFHNTFDAVIGDEINWS